MDLHPAGEREPLRRGEGENAGLPPERAVRPHAHGVSFPEGLRATPVLLPPEMRKIRPILRNGGCLDDQFLAPPLHGRATERVRPLPPSGHAAAGNPRPIYGRYHV